MGHSAPVLWISIIRRPAVLAASLAAVLAAASTPATADGSREVALRLDAPATFHMYNADEGAKATNSDFVVPVFVLPSDAGSARNVKVVVDASGLKDVARAEKGGYGNCTGQGPVFTCVYGDLQNGDGETNAPFTLYGVDGVEPGDSGTVTYTATADNASPVTGTTRMTVGGPTLHSPVAQKPVKGVEPGKSVPLTPRFANHSRFATERGVALQLTVHNGRLSAPHPRNCFLNAESTSAWCEFAMRTAPGTAYRTGVPIDWTADPGTLAGTVDYSWSSDLSRPDGITVHGKGAPLTLTRTADHGLTSGTGNISFETTVQDDYEAVPATVRGRVGDTVTVRLGLRDHGPGRPEVGETPTPGAASKWSRRRGPPSPPSRTPSTEISSSGHANGHRRPAAPSSATSGKANTARPPSTSTSASTGRYPARRAPSAPTTPSTAPLATTPRSSRCRRRLPRSTDIPRCGRWGQGRLRCWRF